MHRPEPGVEQARALIRSSFTTIVREVEDLSCGIFTPDAEMIVQAVTGTPGHINTMATGVKNFVKRYPKDTVKPGDVLITNDAWLCSGHRNDFTSVTPIFKNDVLVGWTSTCCHAVDYSSQKKKEYIIRKSKNKPANCCACNAYQ